MTTFLWQRRKWIAIVLVALLALGGIGAAGRFLSGSGGRVVQGETCVFHGWRAWRDARSAHPAWTTYQLWRASRTCRRAPWRY